MPSALYRLSLRIGSDQTVKHRPAVLHTINTRARGHSTGCHKARVHNHKHNEPFDVVLVLQRIGCNLGWLAD